MTAPSAPDPVKLIAAVLWKDAAVERDAIARLEETWGATDYRGREQPFDATDYYERELGPGLEKRIISFAALVPSDALVDAKLHFLTIEDDFRMPTGRRVNLDPGYLDIHKVVLASVKPAWQKLHLGRGVHADMICRYSKGKLQPFEWTFADYRAGTFDRDFLAIREIYKAQLSSGVA